MAKRQARRSSSMHGVFTRSRSEIFVHRTRSGRARPDLGRRRRLPFLTKISPPPSPDRVPALPASAIKDLRARRIFSPASICMETSLGKTDVIGPAEGGMELSDPVVEEERVEQVGGGVDVVVIQSTPPDNQNAVEVENESRDRTAVGVPEGIADVKTDSTDPPKSRPVLTRCSRSKLFRNPSSFSYRRLLPFLMNLAEDNSGPSDGTQDQLLVAGSKCSAPMESSESLDFVDNRINASPNRSSSNGNLHGWELPTTNVCNLRELDFDEVKSETCVDDPILESKLLRDSSSSIAPIQEALSEEELVGNVRALSCLPSKVESICSMMGPVLEIERKSPPGTPLLGSFHSLERHVLAPRKGILKKHTRGCKGICLCLDCVSFRIHADRAFDFSRKQMEEADEIILGLVKELAGLRNQVEKFVATTYEDARTSALLQINKELVKGACQRASRAEAVANNRRKQMFNDLNIHCRIPGPRVTFAESVEERLVPQEQHDLETWGNQI